jgi:hypothetical protein
LLKGRWKKMMKERRKRACGKERKRISFFSSLRSAVQGGGGREGRKRKKRQARDGVIREKVNYYINLWPPIEEGDEERKRERERERGAADYWGSNHRLDCDICEATRIDRH